MDGIEKNILDVFEKYVGDIIAGAIMDCVKKKVDSFSITNKEEVDSLLYQVNKGIEFFVPAEKRDTCYNTIKDVLFNHLSKTKGIDIDSQHEFLISIKCESDIVVARVKGKNLCAEMGIPVSMQIKVATVISELSRNIYQYAGEGTIKLRKVTSKPPGIEIIAIDSGPGIQNIEKILKGEYKSKSGMGIGLYGSRNLMDDFDIKTAGGKGTKITARIFTK